MSHLVVIGAVPALTEAQAALTADYWERNASPERKAAHAAGQKAFAAAAPALAPADVPPAMLHADAAKRWYDPGYDERPLLAGAPVSMPVAEQLFGSSFDLLSRGAWVRPPTLVAVGRQDFEAPPTSWGHARDHFRDLTIALFERAGHTPQVEVREAFDDLVIDWLRRR